MSDDLTFPLPEAPMRVSTYAATSPDKLCLSLSPSPLGTAWSSPPSSRVCRRAMISSIWGVLPEGGYLG